MPGATTNSNVVLYVEDEESDAFFMQRAFRQAGLEDAFRTVGDGREAIDYLAGSGAYGNRDHFPLPRVVLLDLNLPVVSGFDVLEWIKRHREYEAIPVVVFSSSSRDEDRDRARELGADEFVAKPNSALLFGGVVNALKEKWLRR